MERLTPHLHKDPVAYLPPEITSVVFSYLSPAMLLGASRVSQSWRERTLDSRLWKHKFFSEGWNLESEELKALEQGPDTPPKTRSRRAETHDEQRRQKRRMHAESETEGTTSQDLLQESLTRRQEAQYWSEQSGTVEADMEQDSLVPTFVGDEEMFDADGGIGAPTMRETPKIPDTIFGEPLSSRRKSIVQDETLTQGGSERFDGPLEGEPISEKVVAEPSQGPLGTEPPLISYATRGQPRLNYQQLYKQKRKLEDNWSACAYKSFQLPHRDYPEEAHRECVYTIQYIGRFLVSGSRDRTLRKWDLETQRLLGQPLQGHSASVLCLQFDNSKDEDIIISGSSDTDVIIWRYSTGELVERISQAHREPVLNLKFDHRFLITCSKDKSIKIWNRYKIAPGHVNYPVKGVRVVEDVLPISST